MDFDGNVKDTPIDEMRTLHKHQLSTRHLGTEVLPLTQRLLWSAPMVTSTGGRTVPLLTSHPFSFSLRVTRRGVMVQPDGLFEEKGGFTPVYVTKSIMGRMNSQSYKHPTLDVLLQSLTSHRDGLKD